MERTQQIIDMLNNNVRVIDIAHQLGVSRAWIYYVRKRAMNREGRTKSYEEQLTKWAERRKMIMDKLNSGMSYNKVARELGISFQRVQDIKKREMERYAEGSKI